MRLLGSILLLVVMSCGSTKAKLDGALDSVTKLAEESTVTSKALREELIPPIKQSVSQAATAIIQIQLLAIALERLIESVSGKLDPLAESIGSTLSEVRAVFNDMRDLKVVLKEELVKTGEVRDKVADQGKLLQWLLIIGGVLGLVLIALVGIIIHYKLSTPRRHQKQFEQMLTNGGREKILACIKDTSQQ